MRALIVGGGAIGRYCAVRLAQSGHDVVLLLKGRRAGGSPHERVQLRAGPWSASFDIRVAADPSDPALGHPFELAIVAVKAFSTTDAAGAIAALPACGAASVLSVQNGIGNEEILAQAFGADRVVAGALTVAVDRAGASGLVATAKGGLCIAPLGADPHNWVLAAFGAIPVKAMPDWRALKWSKLLVNILGNGVCAALDWLPEQVYGDVRAFAVERACLLEALDVMSALGLAPVNLIDVPSALLASAARALPAALLRVVLANRVARGRGDKLPSLLQDLRVHRARSEVTVLNGAVSRAAADAGGRAPANARIADVVSGIAEGRLRWDDFRGRPERLPVS